MQGVGVTVGLRMPRVMVLSQAGAGLGGEQ